MYYWLKWNLSKDLSFNYRETMKQIEILITKQTEIKAGTMK